MKVAFLIGMVMLSMIIVSGIGPVLPIAMFAIIILSVGLAFHSAYVREDCPEKKTEKRKDVIPPIDDDDKPLETAVEKTQDNEHSDRIEMALGKLPPVGSD